MCWKLGKSRGGTVTSSAEQSRREEAETGSTTTPHQSSSSFSLSYLRPCRMQASNPRRRGPSTPTAAIHQTPSIAINHTHTPTSLACLRAIGHGDACNPSPLPRHPSPAAVPSRRWETILGGVPAAACGLLRSERELPSSVATLVIRPHRGAEQEGRPTRPCGGHRLGKCHSSGHCICGCCGFGRSRHGYLRWWARSCHSSHSSRHELVCTGLELFWFLVGITLRIV